MIVWEEAASGAGRAEGGEQAVQARLKEARVRGPRPTSGHSLCWLSSGCCGCIVTTGWCCWLQETKVILQQQAELEVALAAAEKVGRRHQVWGLLPPILAKGGDGT